jgi:hypothetical protein
MVICRFRNIISGTPMEAYCKIRHVFNDNVFPFFIEYKYIVSFQLYKKKRLGKPGPQ